MLKTYTEFTKKLLYAFMEKHSKENIVISPYSVANLLTMSADAASGNTRNEIVKSILPNGTYNDMTSVISDLNEEISNENAVYTASASFVKEEIGESIHKDYADDLNEKYGGELLISNDFTESVNEWINEKTEGAISQITDESMSDVLVCMINAIFFHDEWANEYEDGDIKNNRSFLNADGTVSRVTMLISCEENYIENSYFAGFSKPYKNGFSYMALLPTKKGQAFLQKAIKDIDFSTLYNNRTKKIVTVNMPEYSCEFGEKLNQTLKSMGIKELFSANADLSNMSSERLRMDIVINKAKIEVNRKGTRAASVTTGEMIYGNAPDFEQFKDVTLDRPFVYAIIHDKTGIPLFVGDGQLSSR